MSHSRATIERWLGGKQAAVTITFDDWTSGQIHVAVPILEKAQIPATYFVTLNNMEMSPSYDHWGLVYYLHRTGSEIGNHTISHLDLVGLSDSERLHEIDGARELVRKYLPTVPVETFSYPFGSFDETVLQDVMKNHIGARLFSENYEWPELRYDFIKSELDYYKIKEFRINSEVSLGEIGDVISSAIEHNGFVPCALHGVYSREHSRDESWFDAIHEDHFRELLNVLAEKRNDIWVTTFGNAIKYHRMANAMECMPFNQEGNIINFVLREKHGCHRQEFMCSLTVTTEIEEGLRCLSVEQNGKNVAFRQSKNFVQFEAEALQSTIALHTEK